MTLTQRPHPKDTAEVRGAVGWYEIERHGSGRKFLAAVEDTVSKLRDWPQAGTVFPAWHEEPQVRTKGVPYFTYRFVSHVESVTTW